MKVGVGCVNEWDSATRNKVNGEKCRVMHMRRKGVKRTEEKFYVGEEEIAMVEEYKYRHNSSGSSPKAGSLC